MTFEDLESSQQARQLTLGMTCVIQGNCPKLAAEPVELRKKAIGTGQLVGGLIRSTESRKTKLLALLSPLSSLPSPYSDERLRHLRRESRQTLPHPSPATRRHALQGVARRIGEQHQERRKTPLVHNFSVSAFQNFLRPLTSDLCFSVCQHFSLSAFDSAISGFCFPKCCIQSALPPAGRRDALPNLGTST